MTRPGSRISVTSSPSRPLNDRLGIFIRQRRRFIVIVDAQTAAEIEITNLRAFFFHLAEQHTVEVLAHLGQRIDERRQRTSVASRYGSRRRRLRGSASDTAFL